MKKSLVEEIERIHFLTYGKQNLTEQIINSILGSKSPVKNNDPQRANDIDSNVDSLYNNLELAKSSGGLFQQSRGSMKYKKEVESLQVGLKLLGYKLPRYGADGLYGSETQSAINAFKQANNIIGTTSNADSQTIETLIQQLKSKNTTSNNLTPLVKVSAPQSDQNQLFTNLDLATDDGFRTYSDISQKFINYKQANPLGITGDMIANGAKQAFDKYQKYVPPELSLSQLAIEGGIGNNNLRSRPIRTKNPFNVGNVDSGGNTVFNNVQNAIYRYFDIIAGQYLNKGRTPSDLAQNFVNNNGSRYASDEGYESKLNNIASSVNKISKSMVSNV